MQTFKTNISKIIIFTLVLGLFSVVRPAFAAGLTNMKDTMTIQTISQLSDHEIMFVTASGVASGGTIVLTLPSDFDGTTDGTLDFADVDLIEDTGADGFCEGTGAGGTDGVQETLVTAAPAATEWSAVFSTAGNRTLTFTSGGASAIIAAGSEVCIEIGEAANGTSDGDTPPHTTTANSQFKNPTTISAVGGNQYQSTLNAGVDSGNFAVPINDSSQVQLSASVNTNITFDIDTAVTDTNTNQPYWVALGTLASGTLTTSDQTTINSIFIDIDTNASGGAGITVTGKNAGLLSVAANPDKTIALSTNEESIAAGSEEIGLCVESVGQTAGGPLARGTQYDSTAGACSLTNTGTQVVGKILTTATQIFNTGNAAISGGRGEILVKASITSLTPAADDYTETLTLIATGTF